MILNIVSSLLLLAAAWPFLAIWSRRGFRGTFPTLAAFLGVALIGYFFLVVSLALFAEQLLRLLAFAALAGILVQLWRSRPDFGKSRGLPPGRLTLLPAGAWLEQNFFQVQGQLYGPVFKTSHFTKPMVCVVGLEAGFELLRRYEGDALVPPEAAFSRYIPCSYIRSMSHENHRKYRPILQAAVSSEVNTALTGEIRHTLALRLHRMCEEGGSKLSPYAHEALYEALFHLFFGVLPGSDEQRELRELYRTLDSSHQRRIIVWAPPDRAVQEALDRTLRVLQRPIDQFTTRPRPPAEPPRSYLEAAWRHGGADALDRVVLLNLVFLLQVTCTDLIGLYDWLLKKLSDHTDWQDRLRQAIDNHGFNSSEAAGLSQRIVNETFRLEQSEHIYRKVVKPIEIGEHRIPKGWLLRICVRESHRCSSSFEDPESFNPDRFLNRTYGPSEYAPFGMFRRRCIGVDTGLTLGSIFIRELVENYKWQVLDAGRPEFQGWHWTPGSGFAIQLTSRRIAVP